MEFKNSAERNFDSIESQPEWYKYHGTTFELQMLELTPEQWDRINKKSTTREYDRKSRQHVEKTNNRKSSEMAYRTAIIGCRGLTPKIVKDVFKLTWPWPDPDDEEITFTSREVMLDLLWNLGRKSTRLNKFVVDTIIPDITIVEDEEESNELEKKIS